MRCLTLRLLFIMLILPALAQAKIWRVNNNAGIVADFNNLDAALATYQSGDTIHLEPSATAYTVTGNILATGNRSLTIIGNGYNLSQNTGLQQDTYNSMIASSAASYLYIDKFTRFIGVAFNSNVQLLFTSNISDISFESCLFTQDFYSGADFSLSYNRSAADIGFKKNYFRGAVNLVFGTSNFFFSNVTGFDFENNIVLGFFSFGSTNTEMNEHVIRNNVFAGALNIKNSYVANNIFTQSEIIGGSFTNSILKNNLFAISQQSSNVGVIESNNMYGVDMSTVFQSTQTTQDKFFQLLAGSPAIGAGVPNGSTAVDCGAFGGPNPYKLSGIPAIPSIYELQVPTIINTGTNAQINVKSRSNN